MKVAEVVTEAIKPIFEQTNNIKLVEVEYKKLQDGMHLVVYIDKLGGITIEDCEYISKQIDAVLDDINPTNDVPYRLDVSSYGLDKPLKFDWQLKNYINKLVDVKLYKKLEDLKEFTATLVSFTDKDCVFNIKGNNYSIERVSIAYITPNIEF